MAKKEDLVELRNYFFDRLIGVINSKSIKFKNFKKATKLSQKERQIVAEYYWFLDEIYLDSSYLEKEIDDTAIQDLTHEGFHAFLDDFLYDEVLHTLGIKSIGKKYEGKAFEWSESKIQEISKIFFNSLTLKQKNVLKRILIDAKKQQAA